MAADDEQQRQFEAVIARMRRDYMAKFAERAQELEDALAPYRSNQTHSHEQLGRLIHRLAGTAGSFGAVEISERAISIEQRLHDGVSREELVGEIEALIALLRATAASNTPAR